MSLHQEDSTSRDRRTQETFPLTIKKSYQQRETPPALDEKLALGRLVVSSASLRTIARCLTTGFRGPCPSALRAPGQMAARGNEHPKGEPCQAWLESKNPIEAISDLMYIVNPPARARRLLEPKRECRSALFGSSFARALLLQNLCFNPFAHCRSECNHAQVQVDSCRLCKKDITLNKPEIPTIIALVTHSSW